MGTKVEYSINLLATSVDINKLAVGGVDVWEHYQNKGLTNNLHRTELNYKVQDPMDRMLDRNNIEYIKKTMQIHDEIFKHQVRELHRVYSVQKMLMDELKKEIRQQKLQTPLNGVVVSHPHFIEHQHFSVQHLREDLGSRERSGSCCEDTMRMQRGFDLERPVQEEAGPSSYAAFESCKISTCGSDEEMEVDLTLSIGCSQLQKPQKPQLLACSDHSPNEKTREFNSSASSKLDTVGECNDPTSSMSSNTVTLITQERKGPHWLSQGLKLK